MKIMSHSTVAGRSLRNAGERLVRSKVLTDAIPMLRKAFAKKANEIDVFPLFSQAVSDTVWNLYEKIPDRKAAVLVPLVSYDGVPSLLFTTRAKNLPTHAAEVSFPGGHFEASVDSSLIETALRETQEELLGDYPWDEIEIIGQATTFPSIAGTPVTPVIGVLPYEVTKDSFPGNAGEVDDIFCVGIEELLDIETSETSARFHWQTPVFQAGDKRIWGLTAIVTRPLLHRLFKPVLSELSKSNL